MNIKYVVTLNGGLNCNQNCAMTRIFALRRYSLNKLVRFDWTYSENGLPRPLNNCVIPGATFHWAHRMRQSVINCWSFLLARQVIFILYQALLFPSKCLFSSIFYKQKSFVKFNCLYRRVLICSNKIL